MAFRPEQKEQVRQATDLVRLIGEHVKLTPKGREFACLCPFHDDKNPSMYVVPAKQIYHCFVCNASGDAITWMMNYHKLSFPDAVRHLAEQAGIHLDEDAHDAGRARQATDTRKRVAAANDHAVRFFQQRLASDEGAEAREYLQRRGVSDAMIDAFNIGYAPDAWDALGDTAQRQRWDTQGLVEAHLLKPRKSAANPSRPAVSDCFDFFRHRLIFPVFDTLNRPIAFGGRRLREEDNPKYINSPEHALFNKSATLYGIHRAKKPIMDRRQAVIVEGYTDVIACHQAGADNAVATLGTALTPQHVRELRKYADEVVLIFDGDVAGQKAADRALELFVQEELDVRLCVLPDKLDPADFLAHPDHGIDAWNDAIKAAPDALAFHYHDVKRQLDDASTMTARQRIIDAYLDHLLSLGVARTGPFRVAEMVKKLHTLTGVPEADLQAIVKGRPAPRKPREHRPPTAMAPATSTPPTPTTQPPTPNPDDIGYLPDELDEFGQPIHAPYTPSTPDHTAPPDPPDTPDRPAVAPDAAPFVQSNQAGRALAPGETRSMFRAWTLAERQLIGCLLQDNALLDAALSDGVALDEALPPGALMTPTGRELYGALLDRLIAGQPVALAALIGDLQETGRHDLMQEAIAADQAAEAAAAGDPDRRRAVLCAAADALRAAVDDAESRAAFHAAAAGDPDDPLAQARALQDALRAGGFRQTPANITRRTRVAE